jgi:hypothetical protein
MALKGKLKSIGKDGVLFKDTSVSKEFCDMRRTTVDQKLDTICERLNEFSVHFAEVKADINTFKADLQQLKLDGLRTQILLAATPYEKKLYLYDIYKKQGGNSWIEDYISELKADNKAKID